MKISYTWLQEFVTFDQTPDELAALLTAIGLEATVDVKEYDFTGVVVSKVLSVAPMAGSDHLSLCQVDQGDEVVPVVCGAPNVKAGILAPLAKVGARLPGGHKITKTKIRGQVSQGMICAADELGLADDHTGIIVIECCAGLSLASIRDSALTCSAITLIACKCAAFTSIVPLTSTRAFGLP